MMEKTGDFRDNESREDLDMTKKASIDDKSVLEDLISSPPISREEFMKLGALGGFQVLDVNIVDKDIKLNFIPDYKIGKPRTILDGVERIKFTE